MTTTDGIDPGGQSSGLFTLDKFAQHPFYQEVNRRLVALTGLRTGQHVVDLGAGTGAVTRLLAEQVKDHGAEVIAVEPSQTAIEVATRNLENLRDGLVRFIQGSAERLSQLVRGPVDAVFFCNAIHLVQEKELVLNEIKQTLREDGTFSFNTSFYQGAEPPESQLFYRKWMIKALRVLKSEYGISPDKTKVEARHRLTEAEYVALLEDNGFRIRNREVVQVEMPLSGFESISEYSLWIEGVLPGVPLEAGAASLREGARQAFQELGLKFSPRNWLLVVASRA
ncbi:MAG TPA: class I SAM-dependent methyltransferase [Dehalococcoidia bacterium]|jgi:ubiquinone/menaquinone biosynthesis C-methylase UbiE